ncbi:Coenzyme F420 hydrogenase/dehydrogenase, beta subunit C-terminal domain [Clostridium sp. HMP27]|uniref:Coenzyme F420 hydrogenase/dehydrogenase, beta subunit C-terminal domain n=1 Tax=Clostridium sp. HMP27 TaxID=1487921 RepID=UPI00068B264B|nr:Coenzyme F420 hydrogenase/dehydrogenase, beta subunit C-terminal domain [Clostridium sp. HMP27]
MEVDERGYLYKKIGYVVQHFDNNIQYESTSGGAFTAIAEFVINNNGVVFGATIDNDNCVRHIMVDKREDLYKLRGSKYVQSDLGDCFRMVKKLLSKNYSVCFSGTPCQIMGLKAFIGNGEYNLITVDVACKGVPSPKVWKKYIRFQEHNYKSKVIDVKFRDKSLGFSSPSMQLKFSNGKVYRKGHESDSMLALFVNEILSRQSCYKCGVKGRNHYSDFTIFDCWSIGEISADFDDDKGTTSVLINTKKGQEIFNKITDLRKQEYDSTVLVKLDGIMVDQAATPNKLRNDFYFDLDKLDYKRLINKYLPPKLKNKIKAFLKPILYKLGILERIKKLL